MIALDTNILVYAHRQDLPFHTQAKELLAQLEGGKVGWAIPWPCVHEFLSIVTHSKIFKRPTPVSLAFKQLSVWVSAPASKLLAETDSYMAILERMVESGVVRGTRVHDARVAAICIAHKVKELWTSDRDYSRFTQLKTRNPLIK